MLQIKKLSIRLKKDLRTMIENFSFVLNPGDRAVIIGEEGNGKSTILKLIYDSVLIEDYCDWDGAIEKGSSKLGYLAQEISEENKQKTIYEYFCDSPVFHEMAPKEIAIIGKQIGLMNELFYSDQIVGTLSGGEKVKLQLAKILMEQPDVLLLDEPSNDIDIETLEWLEQFINTCGLSVLFISHDETLIENTANIIIHLEQVRRKTVSRYTIAKMKYCDYIAQRMNHLSHQEQMAQSEKAEFQKQQEKLNQIMQKVEHQQASISRGDPHGGRLLKKKMKAVKSQERRFLKEQEDRTLMPDVEESILPGFSPNIVMHNGKTVLDFSHDTLKVDNRTLSQNIKLYVKGPEHICIIGRNGVGKTTLLKQIAEILLSRTDLKAGYMPQSYETRLDFSLTPIQYLAKSGKKEDTTRAATYLGSMKYTSKEMEHSISELSGGQKAKLLFLEMILQGCNVLILDEPTRNFSPLSGPVIRKLLNEYTGTIISISHDRKYIDEVCDKVYLLSENGLSLV